MFARLVAIVGAHWLEVEDGRAVKVFILTLVKAVSSSVPMRGSDKQTRLDSNPNPDLIR